MFQDLLIYWAGIFQSFAPALVWIIGVTAAFWLSLQIAGLLKSSVR